MNRAVMPVVLRGCLMFAFTLTFVSIFSMVAGYFMYMQLGRKTTVEVPSVVGYSHDMAIRILSDAGLVPADIDWRSDPTQPEGTVIDQRPGAYTEVPLGRQVILAVAKAMEETVVPDLRGMYRNHVVLALRDQNLRQGEEDAQVHHSSVQADHVIATYPREGSSVPVQTPVKLLVSKGPPERSYVMPDLVGLTEAEAREILTAAGLRIRPERQTGSPPSLHGRVVGQLPSPGKKIGNAEEVSLTIGAQ